MLTADVKVGTTFEMEGKLYQAVEWQHVCQPRLAAFIRGRIKNIETGQVIEKNFKTNEKVGEVQLERKEMQYLYNDGEIYYFMDSETYEQLPLNKEELGDTLKYLLDNMIVKILSYKGKVFGIEPPMFVELEVTYTEPGFKGNTSTGTLKPATLETGYTVNVPLFVEIGDKVRIDTRSGEYMERV